MCFIEFFGLTCFGEETEFLFMSDYFICTGLMGAFIQWVLCIVLVIVLVGNVFVLELVLGTSVLETSLPIINPNPNLNAIACSNVIPAVDIVYTSRGNKTANINVKNCSLSTTYNGEMIHRKQQK